jgi:Cu(I)/Ag(I) efflux system membrane protein CusA/SilA
MLSGTSAGIAIKLFGTDLNRMYETGVQIKNAISGVEGVADLNIEQQIQRPQLRIVPRRVMLARYGVTPAEFYDIVETMLGGSVVSQVYDDGRTFDIVVKADDSARGSIDDIRDMMVDAGGQKVPLSAIAEITSTTGPNTINRENVARKIVISANVVGGDLRGTVEEIRRIIESEITLPEGYRVEYGGQFESEAAASRTLGVMSLLSVLVIFMLLYGQFHNATQASVVLLNLPLALIGGVAALLVTSGIISIPAIIGFISLFGIATRNGMLLISRYNDLVAHGRPLREAVMEGSLDRLNPIIMTALTSALALIPLALTGDLPGNEIQSPMAQVILGGLLSSTLLNGFVIPVMYILINRKKQK